MAIPVSVPRLGWNMEDGVFLGWLKEDGDVVRVGDMLFALEGEKAAQEIECLDSGRLHIAVDGPMPGDRVLVGTVIGHLLATGETAPPRSTRSSPAVPAAPPALQPAASPSVRRLARESNVDLGALAAEIGSRPISVGDVLATVQALRPRPTPTVHKVASAISTPRARRTATRTGIDWTGVAGSGRNGRVLERDVISVAARQQTDASVSPIRHTIAERMVASCRSNAPVTLVSVVDATNLVRFRKQCQEADGPVPGYTDVLVKLVAGALQAHPQMNARWLEGRIVPHVGVHVGIAVDTEAGLMVPVVRDVPALGLTELSVRTADLINRARLRTLTAKDMQGGSFTVTNLGAFGIDAFTPIINTDQCAVLGVGRIARVPVVRGRKIVARQQLTLSLTFDHRVVDGAPAARFLQAVAERVKAPAPWLVG